MTAHVLVFRLPPRSENKTLTKFCQKFYGQDSSSWGGKYKHHRKGFLEDVPHRKIIRGVIVIRNKDLQKVLDFLKAYSVKIYYWPIKPSAEDIKCLNLSID